MDYHPSWDAYPPPANLPPVVINNPAMPLVSIVTPSYNQGPYVRETIASVLSQDYPNIEYWLIDGGSTDETLAIVREYEADPRFHWLSEPDRGQADAVNKGWSRCRGDIFGWLNSDDTYLPGAIGTQVQVLRERPTVGVVYGDAIYIDPQGHELELCYGQVFDKHHFLHLSSVPQPAAFLRRTLLEQHGLVDTLLHYALDYELFLRLAWKTDFFYNQTPIATYRIYPSSKTVRNLKRLNSESLMVALAMVHRYAEQLPDKAAQTIRSDWYWMGAIRSLDERQYGDALAYSLVAIRSYPLRPRMATFGLKLIDALLHTNLYTGLYRWWRTRKKGLRHAT